MTSIPDQLRAMVSERNCNGAEALMLVAAEDIERLRRLVLDAADWLDDLGSTEKSQYLRNSVNM